MTTQEILSKLTKTRTGKADDIIYAVFLDGEKVATIAKGWTRPRGKGWQYHFNGKTSLTHKTVAGCMAAIADKLNQKSTQSARPVVFTPLRGRLDTAIVPLFQSGDKFRHKRGHVWTLQKLPDFDLWILIGETAPGKVLGHWCAPGATPREAFGGTPLKEFTKL